MGTRLRNCKKTTKGLGGRGKLTDKIIKDLTLYYGLAIRRNMDSLENMKKAIWATFLHKSSTDSHPKHENCPEGPESWCQWQKARALGKLKGFEHKPALPQDVLDAIKPIYTDLSRDDLLKRCLGAFNQNNNESFNNVIWKFAPKTTFNGVTTVHIAANIATIIFNNGHTALLRVLEFMGVCIGMNLVYMDDKFKFSKTIEQHYKDLIVIIKILLNANMKISIEKSKFFKLETNFLGYVVSHNVIKTDPEKISTIVKYPIPKNVRELISFLGLTGYYRKFVQVLGGLWALEWAWHCAETNLRCVRSSGICTPDLNSLAPIVSEISAFIRTDRQTDRRTWLDRLG